MRKKHEAVDFNKESAGRKGTLLRQAPLRGGGRKNCLTSYSYVLLALLKQVKFFAALPDKRRKKTDPEEPYIVERRGKITTA
jgi:hypothetical protein